MLGQCEKIKPWELLVLVICFFFIFYGNIRTWQTEFINYDLIHDYESARSFIESLSIPLHGSVSSFGAFNPPGISYFIIPGILLFSSEPVLSIYVAIFLASVLTIIGYVIFLRKRWGSLLFLCFCMLYLFSSVGWYYLGDLRPRAHPVFFIWTLYLFENWFRTKRSAWFLLGSGVLAFGLYWMLELAPLVVAIGFAVILSRRIPKIRVIAASLFLGLLIWSPYLNFQIQREFKDLKTLLIERESVTNFRQSFMKAAKENNIKRTFNVRKHVLPDVGIDEKFSENDSVSSVNEINKASPFYKKLRSILPRVYFPKVTIFFVLSVTLFSLVVWVQNLRSLYNKKDKDYFYWRYFRIGLIAIICCGLIIILSWKDQPHILMRRCLWLWPVWLIFFFESIVHCDKLISSKSLVFLKRFRIIYSSFLLLGLGLIVINPVTITKATSLLENRFALEPQSEVHNVINDVAKMIHEENLEPRIGYDIPFLAWIVSVNELDGSSRIGIQHDMVFKYRHNITNLNTGPFTISKSDEIRIVEIDFSQPWRNSFLDLREFPQMEVAKAYDNYIVLRKKED